MNLVQALVQNGYDECVEEEVQIMITRVINGEDPVKVLLEYGLDADYEMELLEYLL